MQFKRRQLLILLLAGSQLLCLTVGVLWAARWLHKTYTQCITENAAAESESIAFELVRRLDSAGLKSIAPGSEGWHKLQPLCETINVPHQGYVAIVNSNTGALIWHTNLQNQPSLLRTFPGRTAFVTDQGVTSLIKAAANAEAETRLPVEGEVESQGQLYHATCLSVPTLNAVVAVYISQASLDQSIADLVMPVLQTGFVLTSLVVGATSILTVFLISKFDDSINTLGASVEDEVDRRTLALTRSRSALVLGLAKLAESRDKDAGHHLERIRTYVTLLATELAKHNPEIDHHYVANLASASALHDIGKIGVPDSVILKLGRLTPAERRAMQMHTVLGGECLAHVAHFLGEPDQFIELSRQIAVAHHEQWDGSGYPHGLQGKAIPLAARIVALADVYDALTTRRAYRECATHEEAREWIVSNYGAQFDPEVVEAFVAREQDFAKVSAAAQQLYAFQPPEESPVASAAAEDNTPPANESAESISDGSPAVPASPV